MYVDVQLGWCLLLRVLEHVHETSTTAVKRKKRTGGPLFACPET